MSTANKLAGRNIVLVDCITQIKLDRETLIPCISNNKQLIRPQLGFSLYLRWTTVLSRWVFPFSFLFLFFFSRSSHRIADHRCNLLATML